MDNDLKFIKLPIIKTLYFIKGKATFNYLQELEKNQWLSYKDIEQIQLAKQRNLIDYVYRYVPFYRKVFKSLNLTPKDIQTFSDLKKLPILTKEDIEENISEIISIEYNKKDLIKNSTGGSTGRNLRFFIGRKHSEIRESVAIRGNRWAGLEMGTKHAYLWGSPFDISMQNKIKNRIYNKIIGCGLFLSSYDLSDANMLLYTKKLKQYKPKVIIGYSSPLYLFSKFIDDKKIDRFNIESIISSAEVLYDYQRELIESVFQCKVFNRYGCREFGAIAHECSEHSGMHINVEHVYVECLKEDGNPAASGETGELIITDFDNYGMPFIRYKIGDIGELSNRKCKCGRGLPIIEKVEGRTFDIIIGANGRRVGGTFWTLLLRTSIEGIDQFQVFQGSNKVLNIKIVVNNRFKSDYIDVLTNKIYDYLGKDIKVNFKIVDKIKPTSSGKLRYVISDLHSKKESL